MKIKIRKNHKFLTSTGHIKQICQPLEFFKINLFTYLKNFHDGRQINLSSDSQWVYDYYHLSLFQTSEYESSPQHYKPGFYLWPSESTLKVFKHGRENFDSYYGFTICCSQPDGCEFFFFSLSSENYSMLNTCINHLDLIEKFIAYFKDKTAPIIRDCQSYKIIVPKHEHQQNLTKMTDLLFDFKSKFIHAINGESLVTWLNNFEPLTKREYECLTLLSTKPTTNELAETLEISKRTVETHLEKIKAKLQCRSKHELLIKLSHFHP